MGLMSNLPADPEHARPHAAIARGRGVADGRPQSGASDHFSESWKGQSPQE